MASGCGAAERSTASGRHAPATTRWRGRALRRARLGPDRAAGRRERKTRPPQRLLPRLRDMANRTAMFRDQLGSFGAPVSCKSPVTWEYGKHIHIGDGVFINFECVFLDGAEVRIGDGTAIAPRVLFLTAGHPVDPHERSTRDPVTGQLDRRPRASTSRSPSASTAGSAPAPSSSAASASATAPPSAPVASSPATSPPACVAAGNPAG